MDLGIAGKVAMVCAASKGIGLAIARELAAEGCRVSICGRHEDTLETASNQIPGEVRSYVVDVADSEDLEWWVEQTRTDLGSVGILVTNTGGPPAGALDTLTDAQWEDGFEGTLLNIVRLCRLIQPEMRTAGWGRIVHITSLVAKEPSLVLPISSTLRAGIMGLTRVQATELAPFGVTVNSVLPGHTLTDRQRHLAQIRAERDHLSLEAALERQGKETPIGRLADPGEIAAAVAFLCSRRASYITGVNLLVDGGATKSLA